MTKKQVQMTALEKAENRLKQAKARVAAIKARQAGSIRKIDTRRKVIVGGALIELASRDAAAAEMLKSIVSGLSREQDRKAVEGWDFKPHPLSVPPTPEAQKQPEM